MTPANLNRQQRRQMERQQARQRAQRRVERPVHIPMMVKAQYTLEPLEAVIDQIERTGAVDTDQRGTPIFFCNSDGGWYESASAIDGMADFFDMWAIRHARTLDVTPLRQLAARLSAGMLLDAPLMTAVRHLLPILRRVASTLDRDEAIDLLRGTQINEARQKLEQRA
ncbi:hypothetical protein [Bordetella avium]|uniref:hypothetical protein n=1 Tax=Bordetella avium TaxID=521 RepID=UPI000B3074F9|nr:hypothetical protein [Bordetella avium]